MRWMEVNNMCKILVTDGMNKNAIDNLRKLNIDVEHKFYDDWN